MLGKNPIKSSVPIRGFTGVGNEGRTINNFNNSAQSLEETEFESR